MKRTFLPLIACLFFTLMASSSYAANLKVNSREQAVELVKQQYSGKVLNVQTYSQQKNPAYVIKLLSDKGVVFYLQVNAVSGRISKK